MTIIGPTDDQVNDAVRVLKTWLLQSGRRRWTYLEADCSDDDYSSERVCVTVELLGE